MAEIDKMAERYRHQIGQGDKRHAACPVCCQRIVWHMSKKKGRCYPCNVISIETSHEHFGKIVTYSHLDLHGCSLYRTDEGKTMAREKEFETPVIDVSEVDRVCRMAKAIMVLKNDGDVVAALNAARALDVPKLKSVLKELGIAPHGVAMPGRWRADASKLERLRVFNAALEQQKARPRILSSKIIIIDEIDEDEDPADEPASTQPEAVDVLATSTPAAEGVEAAFDSIRDALKDKLTPAEIAALATDVATTVCEERLAGFEAPEWARPIIVKQPNKPDVESGVQHCMFPELLSFVNCREHVWAWGPAGTGKTVAAEYVAKALDLDFYPYSVGPGTMPSDFVGFIVPGTGSYQETVFRQAFEKGGLFLLDEADKGSAQVMTKLNAALANGYMAFPDGIIPMHQDFTCIACANGKGIGQTRQYKSSQQDGALLNRFVYQYWNYDNALERTLFPVKSWCHLVQEVRRAIDGLGVETIVSMRASKQGCNLLLNADTSVRRCLEVAVYKQVDAATQQRIENWISENSPRGKQWDDIFRAVPLEVERLQAEMV